MQVLRCKEERRDEQGAFSSGKMISTDASLTEEEEEEEREEEEEEWKKNAKRLSVFCPMCRRTYSTRDTLKMHLTSVHLRRKPHACDACGKSFRKRCELVAHRLLRCNRVAEDTRLAEERAVYSCFGSCEKKFLTLGNFERHMRSLERDDEGRLVHPKKKKSFLCNLCGRKLTSLNGLARHSSVSHSVGEENENFNIHLARSREKI